FPEGGADPRPLVGDPLRRDRCGLGRRVEQVDADPGGPDPDAGRDRGARDDRRIRAGFDRRRLPHHPGQRRRNPPGRLARGRLGGEWDMAIVRRGNHAFGAPGIAPRWTQSAKDAVGTAYSSGSTVWFTVSAGILNEVYHPTIDRPQIRDLQYLVTDGESFFHDERRHLDSRVEPFENHALGVRITNTEREGRYRIVKEVIADPHRPCILVHTRLERQPQP